MFYSFLMAITLVKWQYFYSCLFYSFLMAKPLVKWQYLFSVLFSDGKTPGQMAIFLFYSILFQSFLFYKSVVAVCMKFVFVSDVVRFSSISSVKKALVSDRRGLYWLWDSWSTWFFSSRVSEMFQARHYVIELFVSWTCCGVLRFFVHIGFIFLSLSPGAGQTKDIVYRNALRGIETDVR